jgi:hypothetical protein
MMITDVMREADTEYVIYFLLSSYINSARNCERVISLPEHVAALPVTSAGDVRSRFDALMFELDAASKRLDDQACVNIKEALTIFGTALHRLQSLDSMRSGSLGGEKRHALN